MIKKKNIIGIIGSSKSDPTLDPLAFEVGQGLAQAGLTIICGGLGGVMEAACRGVKSADGLTIGILPGTDSLAANPYIDIPIPTGMGEARNIIIIRSSICLIAIGGSYGTLSEIGFTLRLRKPVIGLKTWDLNSISKEDTNIIPVATAADTIKKTLEILRANIC